MSDIQTRPFSKNYSGLINQSVIAGIIAVICITSQEIMKRRRRGKYRKSHPEGLGSIESWEFGYLFQGRSWAKNPSPPVPQGFPLSWIKESIIFPEDKILELRGIDATLYTRWLRACRWFALLHTFTTLPILLPIHAKFSDDSISLRSMTRASISSVVQTDQGLSLLWIHICLLFWITLTWMGTLLWICHGAFYFRAKEIDAAIKRAESITSAEKDAQYHPHPHPQYPFRDIPSGLDNEHSNQGLRWRTVMVENVPPTLRSEKELKEYFEYYMSRPVDKPAIGLTSGMQPGFFNKSMAFLFNRVKRIPDRLPAVHVTDGVAVAVDAKGKGQRINADSVPVIDRVVIVRKMTELASLLQRREEVLRRLETAHLKLARRALMAVKEAVIRKHAARPRHPRTFSQVSMATLEPNGTDVEPGQSSQNGSIENEERMNLLIRTLAPYVDELDLTQDNRLVRSGKAVAANAKQAFRKMRPQDGSDSDIEPTPIHATQGHSFSSRHPRSKTVWEALLSLPRNILEPYQPLISLSKLFRGKTVPSIDYFTMKLSLLTQLIIENRSRAISDYDPVSTAFVTFANPGDARRACKYLAVHPSNPMACLVTMAPGYEDLDWIRVMKSTFRAEFVKDWVVDIGVWAFTIFWLFPVSLLVGFVSIQSISQFWPGLKTYLDHHPWQEEVIQSFVPTLLVSLLALLIPLILLLIAKKAHTISTLSALHDCIMTRYYKFLIVNVLVFFCVGTAAVQTLLTSIKSAISGDGLLNIVATSFPTAGPFYVGWLIFTTALHGGLEIALLGLPLIMYPSTKRQVTPRKRAVGIRPRTFNFYYWLPNHMLIVHILLLFAILNPLVIPFGLIYFCVESTVVRNQLIHVYAKNYEGNGRLILIRLVRYSLDGLMLSQAVFLAYMVVLKKTVNVALAAVLIVFTTVVKVTMTRLCRAQYEDDDIAEASVVCRMLDQRNGDPENFGSEVDLTNGEAMHIDPRDGTMNRLTQKFRTLRLPAWINFSYSTIPHRVHAHRRRLNPFGPHEPQGPQGPSFRQLGSLDGAANGEASLPHADVGTVLSIPLQESPIGEDQNTLAAKTSFPLAGAVDNHPLPVAWDDNSHVQVPYDNPYYTRAISDILWLPRDPFGILDLDDTVNLRVSLTSVPSVGQLGQWHGNVQSPLPGPLASPSSPLSPVFTPSITGSVDDRRSILTSSRGRQYTGHENIDLPSGIACRVANLENEDDVEQATLDRGPSLFNRTSSNKDGESAVGVRPQSSRKSTMDKQRPPPLDCRSSTASGERDSRIVSSHLSAGPSQQRVRSGSTATQVRPDAQATPAQLTLIPANLSFVNLPQSTGADVVRARHVTTQEAVVNEVIAEEQEAAEERLKEEQVEADHANGKKSWLTSWIYARAH